MSCAGEAGAAVEPAGCGGVSIGPYRIDVLEATGVFVSTRVRESSAMDHASPYFETMAFWLEGRRPEGARPLLWQSAAGYRRAADRMHDAAVRWFSRDGVSFA